MFITAPLQLRSNEDPMRQLTSECPALQHDQTRWFFDCWANEQINEETICTNKVHSEYIIVSQHHIIIIRYNFSRNSSSVHFYYLLPFLNLFWSKNVFLLSLTASWMLTIDWSIWSIWLNICKLSIGWVRMRTVQQSIDLIIIAYPSMS